MDLRFLLVLAEEPSRFGTSSKTAEFLNILVTTPGLAQWLGMTLFWPQVPEIEAFICGISENAVKISSPSTKVTPKKFVD